MSCRCRDEDSDYHRYGPQGVPPYGDIVEVLQCTDAESVDETCGLAHASLSIDAKKRGKILVVSTLSYEDSGVDTDCCVSIGYKCGTKSTCCGDKRSTSIAERHASAPHCISGTLYLDHGDRRDGSSLDTRGHGYLT